jgi:hypothetical protein
MNLACFRIDKLWQTSQLSALSNNLPAAVPVNTKDYPTSTSKNWSTSANVFLQHVQGIFINGKYSLAMVFLLLS